MQKRTMLIRAGGDISPQHNCTLHANAPTSALLILMGAMRCALRNATRSERGASLSGCRGLSKSSIIFAIYLTRFDYGSVIRAGTDFN
jgi:hypothetical protein